jgi:hypothetical protein
MFTPFSGTCFGHVIFNACQYVTNDTKIEYGMKKINLMKTQVVLQKTTKNLRKRKQEWELACKDVRLFA